MMSHGGVWRMAKDYNRVTSITTKGGQGPQRRALSCLCITVSPSRAVTVMPAA